MADLTTYPPKWEPIPTLGRGYGQRLYVGPIEPQHTHQIAETVRAGLNAVAAAAKDMADKIEALIARQHKEKCFTKGLPMRGLESFNIGEGDESTGHAYRWGCCPDNGFCVCTVLCSMDDHLKTDEYRKREAHLREAISRVARNEIQSAWEKRVRDSRA
jgi:hypothetical protein